MIATYLLSLALLPAPAPQEDEAPVLQAGVDAAMDGDRIEVTLDGGPFATVVLGGDPKPYVYPLHGPGGVPLTRAYPLEEARPGEQEDHPHHVSFWFAHGAVNGYDFWHGSGRGEHQELVAGSATIVEAGGAASVRASYVWTTDEGPLLDEVRTLRFHGTDASRTVDVDLWLSPAGDAAVTFGDTKEGTFALRLHPALRLRGPVATATIRNAAGSVDGDCWGEAAAWVDYSGTVDDTKVGVAIFDHPDNPRHPTWWHARDYGLFAANPFGAHDFTGAERGSGELVLEPGETLHLRYRVWLHAGMPSSEMLGDAWAAYAGGE